MQLLSRKTVDALSRQLTAIQAMSKEQRVKDAIGNLLLDVMRAGDDGTVINPENTTRRAPVPNRSMP